MPFTFKIEILFLSIKIKNPIVAALHTMYYAEVDALAREALHNDTYDHDSLEKSRNSNRYSSSKNNRNK